MFVRKSIRRYRGKTYTNFLLVESVRTPKGPRQKVVCSLGDLKPRPRAEWLKLAHQIQDALVGQQSLVETPSAEVNEVVDRVRQRRTSKSDGEAVGSPRRSTAEAVRVDVAGISTQRHREAGTVHVGYQFWQRLKLDEILTELGVRRRTRVLTCAMTLNRLIEPSSELAMPEWIRRTALDDLLGVEFETLAEDALYRNMDRLQPLRSAIESALVERERSLFDLEGTVILYDLSSTYFEGKAEKNAKAKRGHSRDKRPDCKQVVVGLVLGREGFPLAHEVFEGNVQDRKTVSEMLDLLDSRVGLSKGQLVVVDRGMAFDENLEAITSRGLHYLVASRQPERAYWLAQFEDADGFEEVKRTPSPRNPYQKKTVVRVKRVERDRTTLVLCMSEEREAKDRAIREKHQKQLVADLAKLNTRVAKGHLKDPAKIHEAMGRLKERYPRVARYYEMAYDSDRGEFSYMVNEGRRAVAERLDGSYILKTDIEEFSADEAWRVYTLLTRVEDAFRAIKSPLVVRPVFHQCTERVETHIFLSVLAYHLLAAIEKTLRDQGVHTSWETVRTQLRTHQVCTVVLPIADDHRILEIRKAGTPEPEHEQLYRLLKVPSEVMRPKITWTSAEL